MSEDDLTRVTTDEIRRRRDAGQRSRTDWAYLDGLTDDEIERSISEDLDWAEFASIDWSKAQMVYPVAKSAISIRLDNDIIDFFKAGGKGYQSRINAVLRHFMTEQTKVNKA